MPVLRTELRNKLERTIVQARIRRGRVSATCCWYPGCGPPLMIDAIDNMLDSLGVEPEMIAYDKF